MRRKVPEHIDDLFCCRNVDEELASISGQTAMLVCTRAPPGSQRLLAFHALRVAAKRCPGAAYNLANYLSGADRPDRPRRYEMATDMLITAAEMAKERISDPDLGDDEWPDSEYFIRDVASRALTDIGARISNAGQPAEAVPYFREAIRLFRGNSNSWVCLGNMGIYFSVDTGVDPVEGVQCWKEAFSMCDPEADVDGIEADRRKVVSVLENALILYGPEAVREFVEDRLVPLLERRKKGMIEIKPLAMEASDLEEVTGKPWSSCATGAAELIGGIIEIHVHEFRLEQKVTLAASLLLSLLNCRAATDAEKRKAVEAAMQMCDGFEPLHPMLGDEEWRDIGLPDTGYLTLVEAKEMYSNLVKVIAGAILEDFPRISAADAAAAVLFHLDHGFRRGVVSMIAPQIGRMNSQVAYLPAVYVGAAHPKP